MKRIKNLVLLGLAAILILVGLPLEESMAATPVRTLSKHHRISYKKRVHKKRVHKKRVSRHRRSRRSKRITVNRGATRTSYAEVIRQAGSTYWSDPAELDALVWISNHECTTPGRVSNGFYGLFQLSSPPRWMVLGDAYSETIAGCSYIKRRYGTPLKAKAFWLSHHWY